MQYNIIVGEPFTEKQILLNKYLLAKRLLQKPITSEDYNIDPLGKDEKLFNDIIKEVKELDQIPFNFNHLIDYSPDHSNSTNFMNLLKSPYIFFRDLLHTSSASISMEPGKIENLVEGQLVITLKPYVNYVLRRTWYKFKKEENLYPRIYLSDFIHNDQVCRSYNLSNVSNYYDTFNSNSSLNNGYSYDEYFLSKWRSKDSLSSKFQYSNSEFFPFSQLDNYYSVYSYFIYKNAGTNYLNYTSNKSYINNLEKMLSYTSDSFFYDYLSSRLQLDWNSVVLKLFNKNYQDTFVNPLFNFINNRAYYRMRHQKADALTLSSSLFRARRRAAHWDGYVLHRPRLRDVYEDNIVKAALKASRLQHGSKDKYKRLRMSTARQMMMAERAKVNRHLYEGRDHLPVNYSKDYPIFYDFLDFYRLKANINPLSRLKFNGPEVPSNVIPSYSSRLGSRLYRKLGYVNMKLEGDSSNPYILYIHQLQQYLNRNTHVTTGSFKSIDLLFDRYLSDMNTAEISNLLNSYFFRSNYLRDFYHRFNFSSIAVRSKSSIIRRHLITKGRYAMRENPWYKSNDLTSHNFYVKLNRYDIYTRLKLDLISTFNIDPLKISSISGKLHPMFFDLTSLSFFHTSDFFIYALSFLTLFGTTIFNFYTNIELIAFNLFNEMSLYPWMNPIIKNIESFWYSSQFFHMNFSNYEDLIRNDTIQYGYNSSMSDIYNSPYDQLKDNLRNYTKLKDSLFLSTNSIYEPNSFFFNQYYYYIYQSRNVIKLPFYNSMNSSIVYFQWDNMPLFDLVSHSYSLNMLRFYESFTYNLFKHDLNHLIILGMKDLYYNLLSNDINSLFLYCYYLLLEFFGQLLFFLFSYLYYFFTPWLLFVFMKFTVFSSLFLFNDMLNNLTFLNIKHLFIDLPYWYLVDSLTSVMFHWCHWTYHISDFLNGSYWLPTWYFYELFDNYIKIYLVDYYYDYYKTLLNNSSTIGEYMVSSYALLYYWVIVIPLFYLIRFIFISFLIESYGIFFVISIYTYYYLVYLNNSKNYAWLFKDINNYDIRSWMLKYHTYHREYTEFFAPNTELLLPYVNRRYSRAGDFINRFKSHTRHSLNSIDVWRSKSNSIYRKYPDWKHNYYNYPDVTKYLFDLNTTSLTSDINNKPTKESDLYKTLMFSENYMRYKNKIHTGFSKFPLFSSYPNQVQPYYRKVLWSFPMAFEKRQQLFNNRFSFLVPFILLGKHYEDQNFISSLKASSTNILSEINRKSFNMNENFYFRYYYLRKYFPFYAKIYHSNYRIRNLSKRYRKRGRKPFYFDLNYRYVVWDGGSHSIFLLPGISSLSDESLIDVTTSDVPVYRRGLLNFLNFDNSVIYEDWFTDGSFPDSNADLNFSTQYPENLVLNSVNLINTIERQRRILFTLVAYRPGFSRLYPQWVQRQFRFKRKKFNEDCEIVRLSDDEVDIVDSIHHYYFRRGRYRIKTSASSAPYLKKAICSYNWTDYKTNLLWYINQLKDRDLTTFKTEWHRDFDIGDFYKFYNFEFSLLRSNFFYPLFYFNTLGSDYKYSFDWYKLHKLHNLNLYYKKKILPNWELSKSWEIDMGVVDDTEITDTLGYNIFTRNFSEIFDGSINSKLIPTFSQVYTVNSDAAFKTPSFGSKLVLMKLHFKDFMTRRALMGKYYRYLYYKHSIDMRSVDVSTGMAFKLDFRRHPNNLFHNFHYLGLTGRLDYMLDRLSYDFDTGWVKVFNFISYRKYSDQRASLTQRERKLSKMLTEASRTEEGLKQFALLDTFSNANLFSTFYSEFGELSSSIYYAWLTQQYYNNRNNRGTYLLNKHKYSYLLGNSRLMNQYGYTKYAKIKDTLRDTHNYINYAYGQDNYPISLKSIENFYEYDRFTMAEEAVDVRWDGRLMEGLSQIRPGRKHILYRHFRDTGPKIFKSSKNNLYRRYRRSFHKSAPFIDIIGKRPGDLQHYESHKYDLLSNRILNEFGDHLHNLFNINFDLSKLEIKPILFYKVPEKHADNWLNFQKSISYYSCYDNDSLNNLKQNILDVHGGSWKYYYFKQLLDTNEYDYIFESTLQKKYDKYLDYQLLESYCDRELTGALLTKRYLIYREKLKSISPNASLFFNDFYPEYIWEYYDFNWYEEIKTDWFIIIPLFALFFVYYMNVPHDYYKFSRKRFKRTLYVHHINRRKRGGPKNAHRRLFAIPHKLKKQRLSFYRLQSKNNILMSSILSKRKNLRTGEYLYPYRTVNPYNSSYTSRSQLKFKSRVGRSIRLNNPRKFVFYSGYTVQLRMNRRRARRVIRHRLKGYSKDRLYSNLKILRHFQSEPYNTPILKDKEIDSYLKVWHRNKAPRSTRRYKRRPNPYRRPFKRPYRRYYSFEFYKTMITNDLLRVLLFFKSLLSSVFGTVFILVSHFIRHPLTLDRFKITLNFLWNNIDELIPTIRYLKVSLFDSLIPSLLRNILYLTANTNPYNIPFGLENRKKVRRYWRGKRRNYRERTAIYSAIYALFFNWFIFPVYIHVIKPIKRLTFFVTRWELGLVSSFSTNLTLHQISLKLSVLYRLIMTPPSVHSNAVYSRFIIVLYSISNMLKVLISVLFSNIIYYFFFIVKPILFFILFGSIYVLRLVFVLTKPVVTLLSLINHYCYFILFPFKFITLQFFVLSHYVFFLIQFYLLRLFSAIYYILIKPLIICFNLFLHSNLYVVNKFFMFYSKHISLIVHKFKLLLYSKQLLTSSIGILKRINLFFYYPFKLFILPILFIVRYILFSLLGQVISLIFYINLFYIEPILYWVSYSAYYIERVVCLFVKQLKYKLSFVIPHYLNFHTIYSFISLVIGMVLKLIWSFIYIFIHVLMQVFYKALKFTYNYYVFFIFALILFLSFLSSFCLNSAIFVVYLIHYLNILLSTVFYYGSFFTSFSLYFGYLMLSPLLYSLLVFIKFCVFVPIIMFKLLFLYFCCFIYILINIINCYYVYMQDTSLNFIDLFTNIFDTVVITSSDYTLHVVYNYVRNVIHFFVRYYLLNNIYDILCYYDYFMNKSSVEFYFSYQLNKRS